MPGFDYGAYQTKKLRSNVPRTSPQKPEALPTPAPKAGPSRPRQSRPPKPPSSTISDPPPETQETNNATSSSAPEPETQHARESDPDPDELWEAECILDEKGPPRTGAYLVKWSGIDPATNEPYEHSWEPRSNVTWSLADEWKQRKKADPSIVGVEGKKFAEQLKAKRAAESKKKRKRESFGKRSKKRARGSTGRASASTGTATPARGTAEPTPKPMSEATLDTAPRKDGDENEFDGIEDVPPADDGVMEDAPVNTNGKDEPISAPPQSENHVQDDDVIEIPAPVAKLKSPAREEATVDQSPPPKEAGHVESPQSPQVEDGPTAHSPADGEADQSGSTGDRPAGREKRVRVDSVPVTIGADDLASTSTPTQNAPEPALEGVPDDADGLAAPAEPVTAVEDSPQSPSDQGDHPESSALTELTTKDDLRDEGDDLAAPEEPLDVPADEESQHPKEPLDVPGDDFSSPIQEVEANKKTSEAAPAVGDVQAEVAGQDDTDESLDVPEDDVPQPVGVVDRTPDKSKLAPIPMPDAERFRSLLPPAQTGQVDNTQSTTSIGPSQLDPISQFSSPLRDSIEKAKKDHVESKANGGQRQEEVEPMQEPVNAAEPVTNPKVVTRFINGEEVMAVESDSDETDEATQEYRQPPQLGEQAQAQEEPLVAADDAMEVDKVLVPPDPASPEKEEVMRPAEPQAEAQEAAPFESSSGSGSSSPAVIIHTTQAEYTQEDITDLDLSPPQIYAAWDPFRPDAATKEYLERLEKQADEIESLRRLVESKDAEIRELSTRPAVGVAQEPTLPTENDDVVPASKRGSRASTPRLSSRKTQSLGSQRDSPLNEQAKSHLTIAFASLDPDSTGPYLDETPNGHAVAGPSSVRRTANSSTPPAHMTSAEADFALRLAKKDAAVKAFKLKVQKAEKDLEMVRQQLAFVQVQYNNASDSAVREVSRANELEEQVERLRGQLKLGMKQREMITSAVKAEHAKEVDKLKGQVKLLLDQNRATDDVVRSRAAAYKDLKSEIGQLRAELTHAAGEKQTLSAKYQTLSARNDQLLGEVELFRAREMGVVEPAPNSDSDDSTYATESDDDDDLSPPPRARPKPAARASILNAPAPTSVPVSESIVIDLKVDDIVPHTQSTELREGQAYPSPWTPGLFFADEAAVKEHVMQDIDRLFA